VVYDLGPIGPVPTAAGDYPSDVYTIRVDGTGAARLTTTGRLLRRPFGEAQP
jgi:hypothetical protein